MPLKTQVTVSYDITAENFFNLFTTFIEHNSFSREWVQLFTVTERITQHKRDGVWHDGPDMTGSLPERFTRREMPYYVPSPKGSDWNTEAERQVWSRDWRVRIDVWPHERDAQGVDGRKSFYIMPSDLGRVAQLNPELFWRWLNPDDTTFDIIAADSIVQLTIFGKEIFG
jgi:hypothetical protein